MLANIQERRFLVATARTPEDALVSIEQMYKRDSGALSCSLNIVKCYEPVATGVVNKYTIIAEYFRNKENTTDTEAV